MEYSLGSKHDLGRFNPKNDLEYGYMRVYGYYTYLMSGLSPFIPAKGCHLSSYLLPPRLSADFTTGDGL